MSCDSGTYHPLPLTLTLTLAPLTFFLSFPLLLPIDISSDAYAVFDGSIKNVVISPASHVIPIEEESASAPVFNGSRILAHYNGQSYNTTGNVWTDLSGNGYDTVSATDGIEVDNCYIWPNGQKEPYVYGTASHEMRFPPNIMDDSMDWTFCHLTKYDKHNTRTGKEIFSHLQFMIQKKKKTKKENN